jgi:tetratricopeptide (TPR) repeat protein
VTQMQDHKKTSERTPVERLVDIADAIFERATKLDGVKLDKRDDGAEQTINETKDEGFSGVIAVWRLIIDMLPTSGLEFGMRKSLEIDGHKVISRCHHRLGNMEKAKGEITLAINLGYDDGFISLGAICMDTNDFEAAETAFHSALAKGAQTMRAHAGLGELYFAKGTNALKKGDQQHVEYFEKAEEEFMAAAKERFTESYERAMDLFSAIGWKDKALSIGEKAVQYYTDNRLKYGDKLRNVDARIRKLAGDDRYERILARVGRRLGDLMGGKGRDPNR